jgi:hypothetical protein
MTARWALFATFWSFSIFSAAAENLLLNADFQFQSFTPSRTGKSEGFKAGSVPFWDQNAYGDVEVYRAPMNPVAPPTEPVDGVVVLKPGKSLRQFRLLGDLKVDVGEELAFSVDGHQKKAGSVRAEVFQNVLDEQSGEWKPSDFGKSDTKTYKKLARGELTPVLLASAEAKEEGDFSLSIPKVKIEASRGLPIPPSGQANIMGLEVVLTNTSDEDVMVYNPNLVRLGKDHNIHTELPDDYRYLPRTMAKLRKGEPLHVIVMGSSIDRGSANPRLGLYNEDLKSPEFKQPLPGATNEFDGQMVDHPEWTPYFGWWQHYLNYGGRLRRALMRRFDYPIDRLLFNYMASDGSCISESHSALAEWANLVHPPDPSLNGHQKGKTWKELYPALFERPEGPRPDLVIFGSGANEQIDGPEEVAAFEGAIRWFQRHYPGVEFVFCILSSKEKRPAFNYLKDLSLHYGIPFIDISRTANLAQRGINPDALFPVDGHPQAVLHDLWARALESAFQPVDPMAPGLPQQHLPDRLNRNTIGWEGDVVPFNAGSPRIYREKAFVLEDTVASLWATSSEKNVDVFVDGVSSKDPRWMNGSRLRPSRKNDPRNSTFVIGKLSLGDRHILEVGEDARIAAVDSKAALNRTFLGVESGQWTLPSKAAPFASEWGHPYGTYRVELKAGQKASLEWIGTDCSVAWLSKDKGGKLSVKIDGAQKRVIPTDEPMVLGSKEVVHMENRAGILNLPYGVHKLEVEALDGSVDLLGLFQYDTRPNLKNQKEIKGMARPGGVISFSEPFRATPLVIPGNGVKIEDVSSHQIKFHQESEPGVFQAIGE